MTVCKTSFRDPSGCVIEQNGQILRNITDQPDKIVNMLVESQVVQNQIASRSLISFEIYEQSEEAICLKHPKIWFPSYPYEWSYSMLLDAADLTNTLALKLQKEGLGLKDATPYNILFDGVRPVFVDMTSIERRESRDPLWRPQSQFVNMFLLPLLMHRTCGLRLSHIFLAEQGGLSPEICARFKIRWKRDFLSLVLLPQWLARFAQPQIYKRHLLHSSELAQFILRRRLLKNKKTLVRFQVRNQRSRWSEYMKNLHHYSKMAFRGKEQFVQEALEKTRPNTLLDVGCNTGHFSKMAAGYGCRVVSIDSDPVVVDELYRDAKRNELDILPLVVNLSNPSPSIGWKNLETWSFLERSKHQFSFVLMLAVIHHMLVTDRIPMSEIANLVSSLTTQWALIEYIDPKDPMFCELERGRDLYSHLTIDCFRAEFSRYFNVKAEWSENKSSTRTLFLLYKGK